MEASKHKELTKKRITELLQEVKFDPYVPGPMRVIIELQNIDYLLGEVAVTLSRPRTKENILHAARLLLIARNLVD